MKRWMITSIICAAINTIIIIILEDHGVVVMELKMLLLLQQQRDEWSVVGDELKLKWWGMKIIYLYPVVDPSTQVLAYM